MNLAVIEKMVVDGDLSRDALEYLLGCRSECEWLDYKESLAFASDKALCDFTRDALAMKNVGGGYIVVGVRDKTWDWIGVSGTKLDTKMLRDQVRKVSGVDLDIDLVHHSLLRDGKQKEFTLIHVRSSRKRSKRRTPTVTAKDYKPKEVFGIRRGEIFVRQGDSTVKVDSQSDLENLLDRLEDFSDSDSLVYKAPASPFAVQSGLYRLLHKGFGTFIGRVNLRQEVADAVMRDPRIWIINVHGPGGVGKSALVNWATYKFYSERQFECIVHLSAKETALTPEGIVLKARSLYSLENLLDQILAVFEEDTSISFDSKKSLTAEYLSAYSTLLVLDNMETVSDGRILDFVRGLPVGSRAKVLMTSREKTGGWEFPIPVSELDVEEVREFLERRTEELGISFELSVQTCSRVAEATGGLPLAIEWLLGQYRNSRDLDGVFKALSRRDSPVLEFSFRTSWSKLSSDAKTILAIATIFDVPPTVDNFVVATEIRQEFIERALAELVDFGLLTRRSRSEDGKVIYIALPITLSFARHQLNDMGELELKCRRRFQKFTNEMELQESEIRKFQGIFSQYGIQTDIEKRAAILCRKGESEMFVGHVGDAENLFAEARKLAPTSSYVFSMSASHELARNRIGNAMEFAVEACKRATRETGSLAFSIKARIHDIQRDRTKTIESLQKALEFDPADTVVRHQYGVALSRAGFSEPAIGEFSKIITEERDKVPLRLTFLMALKTRIINLRRLRRFEEASRDLEWAKEIVANHPHLHDQVWHIAELEGH